VFIYETVWLFLGGSVPSRAPGERLFGGLYVRGSSCRVVAHHPRTTSRMHAHARTSLHPPSATRPNTQIRSCERHRLANESMANAAVLLIVSCRMPIIHGSTSVPRSKKKDSSFSPYTTRLLLDPRSLRRGSDELY
jgi:hypothetical protein